MPNLIIYGGTFDPIHNGHINTAINIQNHFNFERFIFLPCKDPLLKNAAQASAIQRVDMIELALAYQDPAKHFSIDLTEINRDSPSYMVNTLEHFREIYGKELAITLIMGNDTFSQLPQWHHWQDILGLTNLLVINRAGYEEQDRPEVMNNLLIKHETKDELAISQQAHGLILRFDAGHYNFSSSWVREQLREKNDLRSFVPEVVLQYIQQNNLYTFYG